MTTAEQLLYEIGKLVEERDAYRAQATTMAEALVELGRQDIVDVAIEKAGEKE